MFKSIRRFAAPAAIALAVGGGLVAASAASLGGITSSSLGADNTVIASCDSDGVSTAFTNAYSAANKRFETGTVTVSGISADCAGKSISVVLHDAAGTTVASGTVGSIAGTTAAVSMTTPADAEAVTGVAIVING